MDTPIRGELTRVATKAHLSQPAQSVMDEQIEKIQGILSHAVRLSSRTCSVEPVVPTITVSSVGDSLSPWTWTAAEATTTETSLLPFVTHLAVARDDLPGLGFCLRTDSAGELANWPDVSGRSPLHTAAINNSVKCLDTLLKKGALVHLRDALGHTPLYYVNHSRQPAKRGIDTPVGREDEACKHRGFARQRRRESGGVGRRRWVR